ncbi:MAG: YdcH family protein [Dongiaceae bacterium]
MEHPEASTLTKEDAMMQEHIRMLKAKHAQLEEAVRVESARPMPDFFVITELKRKRLRLKEEIADAEAGMAVKAAS